MAEVGSAFVSILPSARGFGSKLDSAITPGVTAAGKKSGKSWGSTFGSAIKGTLAGLGIAKIGSEAIQFLGDSLAEGREAEKVGKRTEGVIKSMGLTSEVSAGQIADLSQAISNKSAIDDEQIQKTANLLLGFKNLSSTAGDMNGNFAQATALATDMSAALEKDAKSGAIQLGRALNDPIKGMTALTRVGVSFTEQQQNQIKALVASGDTLGAQGIILDEVAAKFGGAAEQMANPSEKAGVAVANLKEQIGTGLIPVVNSLAVFATTSLIPAISSLVVGIGHVVSFVQQNKTAVLALVGAMTALIVVTKVHAAFLAVEAAGGLLAFLRSTKLITAATKTYTAVQWLLNAALTANPIGIVIVALAALGVGLVIAYKKSETFRNIVNGAFTAVKAAIDNLVGRVQSFIADWKARFATAEAVVKAIPGTIRSAFSNAGDLLQSAGQDIVRGLIDGIKSMAGAAADAAVSVVKDALNSAKAFLKIGSPSKEWEKVGDWSIKGLIIGLEKGGKAAEKVVDKFLDRITDQIGTLRDRAKEIAESVASAFTQDAFGGSLADFLSIAGSNVTTLTTMQAALGQLTKLGASAAFIKALFTSGNAGLINELVAGGASAVSQAQGLFQQQNALGDQLGSSVAGTVLSKDIHDVRDEIRALRKDIRKSGKENAQEFAAALNKVAAQASRISGRQLSVA